MIEQFQPLADLASHPVIVGAFDMVAEGCALGWAHIPTKPDRRLTIEIVSDTGEVVASGLADRLREDLLAAGIGDGRDGPFDVALPPSSPGGGGAPGPADRSGV